MAIAFTSASSTSFLVATADSFLVTTSGTPTPTVQKTAGSLPAGVVFGDNGDGTAMLAGRATTTGTYSVTLQASNGVDPNVTQSFTFTVTNLLDLATYEAAFVEQKAAYASEDEQRIADAEGDIYLLALDLPKITVVDLNDAEAELAGAKASGELTTELKERVRAIRIAYRLSMELLGARNPSAY